MQQGSFNRGHDSRIVFRRRMPRMASDPHPARPVNRHFGSGVQVSRRSSRRQPDADVRCVQAGTQVGATSETNVQSRRHRVSVSPPRRRAENVDIRIARPRTGKEICRTNRGVQHRLLPDNWPRPRTFDSVSFGVSCQSMITDGMTRSPSSRRSEINAPAPIVKVSSNL